MEIDEIRKLKEETEGKIKELLQAFIDKSKVEVREVRINTCYVHPYGAGFTEINQVAIDTAL